MYSVTVTTNGTAKKLDFFIYRILTKSLGTADILYALVSPIYLANNYVIEM